MIRSFGCVLSNYDSESYKEVDLIDGVMKTYNIYCLMVYNDDLACFHLPRAGHIFTYISQKMLSPSCRHIVLIISFLFIWILQWSRLLRSCLLAARLCWIYVIFLYSLMNLIIDDQLILICYSIVYWNSINK